MKRAITIFLICILTLFSVEQCSAEVLFGKEYYEELREHIAGANSSILIGMYLMISKPKKEADPIDGLLDDLIEAKNRGVVVKVVLEDSRMGVGFAAYNKLKENGIQVCSDVPGKLLHLKAVVIDGRYVFLGSANWTRAAMEDNQEATNFSESEEDAQKLSEIIAIRIKERAKNKIGEGYLFDIYVASQTLDTLVRSGFDLTSKVMKGLESNSRKFLEKIMS